MSLSPTLSSNLARDVYALSKLPSLRLAIADLKDIYGQQFIFAESNMLTAKTGPIGIKISTAFGFVLAMQSGPKGKEKPNGHAVILFRGTESLADWLTNGNLMTSSTASGLSVHDGFHKAFKSMQIKISTLLGSLKNIHTIHCVGHSLGGALATLCADWLKEQKKTAYLYTFGSPRTGLRPFAKNLTTKMNGNIHRVYHRTDPVSVIPIWPYAHVPESGADYLLYSSGDFFNAKYHSIAKAYCPKVAGHSWDSLPTLREAPKSDFTIMRWLKSKIKIVFSYNSIMSLNDALMFVLKQSGYVIPKTITNSLSLLDSMAYALKKGLTLAATAAKWIVLFVKKLLEILGVVKDVKADLLSKEFLRELLSRLQKKVTIEAEKALRIGLA
jgi:hypothetical protein